MHELTEAAPLVRVFLATDPSLRGLVQMLSLTLLGQRWQRYSLDDMSRSLNMAADTVEDALAEPIRQLFVEDAFKRPHAD